MLNIRLSMPSATIALLLGVLAVNAAPAPSPHLEARQSITTLSTASIEAFKPYSFYASTGYCDASVTLTWTCGSKQFFLFLLEWSLTYVRVFSQLRC